MPQCRLVRPVVEATWSDIRLAQISWATWIRENVGSCFEGWIVSFEKGSFACCHSTESQLGRPKLPNVCLSDFHLSALVRVFFRFLVLKNPCFSNLQNPVTNSCTNATYQNKPFLLGVPAHDVRLWLYIYLLHFWYNYYIYAPLTPRHLLRFRPSFASAQVYTFPAADTSPFLPPRVWNKRLDTCEALLMSVSYDLYKLTPSSKSKLQFLIELLGVNNTSAVRTIWVTAYTTNFKTQATFGCEMTHLKPQLVWCSLKHDIHWTCCERQQKLKPNRRGFLNHWSSQPGKTQRHGLKKDGAIFRTCNAIDTANFRNPVGPCMDFCVHVLDSYLKVVFNWLLYNLKIDRSISHGSEYILFMHWSRC